MIRVAKNKNKRNKSKQYHWFSKQWRTRTAFGCFSEQAKQRVRLSLTPLDIQYSDRSIEKGSVFYGQFEQEIAQSRFGYYQLLVNTQENTSSR